MRYIRTATNPSPQLILEASMGLQATLRCGQEVQWFPLGEDGEVPVLVDARGPVHLDAAASDWGELQDWAAQERADALWVA